MSAEKKQKPVGWDLLDNAKSYHWFGSDGRSLCGKWAFLGWNILLDDKDVHPDNRCKACNRRRAAQTK